MFSELSPGNRAKVFRGALRRTATKVRRMAVGYLLSSGLGHAKEMQRGIRSGIRRKSLGFFVTVATGRNGSGIHRNRFGKLKPILIWAEDGTKLRKTRSKSRIFTRKRKGHTTGSMPAYGFIDASRQSLGGIESGLRTSLAESVVRVAKRYGCN